MRKLMTRALAEDDIRFLVYRLEAVANWPTSPRKQAVTEAITRRLASIARLALDRPGIDDLLTLSCSVLEDVFTGMKQRSLNIDGHGI